MKLSTATIFCGIIGVRGLAPSERDSEERGYTELLTDINKISRSWGHTSTYADNPEDYFGVDAIGLPDGCQIEQAHSLQRHAQRFPTGSSEFAKKLANFISAHPDASFTGPLTFLNNYEYILSGSGLLTGIGANTEFAAGVSFWNRYGRTLFNASAGQLTYSATLANGTTRRKPVLRTTSQSRMENSQISWAAGFFGPTFEAVPDPLFTNATSDFEVVVIPERTNENNTLASYLSCPNALGPSIQAVNGPKFFNYIEKYLKAATQRLQKYAPEGLMLSVNDTYAFQSTCAYENGYIGMSDFCYMFTAEEWAGFENSIDIEFFYNFAFGNPAGRALGIGYVQELLARIMDQYIPVSNSSVNSTLTNNANTFPLNEPFYADFTHDNIITAVLAALNIDYFNDPPSLTQFPPDPDRHFTVNKLTPFGARLITEVIGCKSADPAPISFHRTQYTPTQYGYDPQNAPNKFIRMRLNNGILPLHTIPGGACGNSTSGRTDGMCEMGAFLKSQEKSYALSDYNHVCFG